MSQEEQPHTPQNEDLSKAPLAKKVRVLFPTAAAGYDSARAALGKANSEIASSETPSKVFARATDLGVPARRRLPDMVKAWKLSMLGMGSVMAFGAWTSNQYAHNPHLVQPMLTSGGIVAGSTALTALFFWMCGAIKEDDRRYGKQGQQAVRLRWSANFRRFSTLSSVVIAPSAAVLAFAAHHLFGAGVTHVMDYVGVEALALGVGAYGIGKPMSVTKKSQRSL